MLKGSILLSGFLLILSAFCYNVSALSYGTTCAGAVDLSSTVGVGAGFQGLIDSPFDQSWVTSSPSCSNSLNTLIASQQWVWYSLNAGSGSYILVSTINDDGADAGSVDTILFATTTCSSASSPTYCNDDSSGLKSKIEFSATSGTYKIAIGQYAYSSTSGVTYPGKTAIKQYCTDSCSVCNALPAKLFYPNAATEYTYVNGGYIHTSACGDFYNRNYYTFTAPSAGTVLISTCVSDGAIKTHTRSTKIAVYSASSCNSATCGTYSSDCSNSASITFDVTQGTTYTVNIGSTSSNSYNGVGIPVFKFTCAAGTYDHDNNQNTACLTCSPTTNCQSFTACTPTSDTICPSCVGGASIANCKNVNCATPANPVCTACNSGFYLSDNTCIACTPVSNCSSPLTCTTSTNSVCTSCNSGSYLSSGSCLTCSSKANCVTVTCTSGASSTCTICNSGYYLSSGSCSACTSKANCATVTCTSSSNSACAVCNDGYYVSGSSCSTCGTKSNCTSVTCSSASNSVCTSCQVGYYINGAGACVACTPVGNCSNTVCTTSSNSVCTNCNNGYYPDNGACTPCTSVANCTSALTCSTSSNSVCTVCSPGSYLNSGKTCSVCIQKTNCANITCTTGTSSTCTACNVGSYLSGSGSSSTCSTCPAKPNCAVVSCSSSSNSVCISCRSGYYLNSGSTCVACTPVDHCTSPLTCSTSLNSVCTLCENGYYVVGGICDNTCPSGTYFNGDSSCIDCTPVANCTSALTCTSSSDSVCTSCSSGTYLNSGTCSTCTSKTNCTSVTCTDGVSSTCTACNSGSYLNSGSCSTCSSLANCNTVTCSDGASSTCTNCNSGYYLNSGSCSLCTAVPHCNSALTCTTSSNSVCTSCVSGHFVDSGLCTECSPVDNCSNTPTCSNPSNSVCTSCNSGYYVNSGVCAACTAILNCNSTITCSTSSNSVCTSCSNGYYLNSGSCTVCTPIPNCNSDLTCSTSSNSVCTSCDIGHYLSSPNTCSDCLPKANCTSVSCSNETVSTCTECDSGYTLQSGNCIISNNKNNDSNSEGASSFPIAAVAGAAGGVLFLLLLILLVILVRRRKSRGNKENKIKSPSYHNSKRISDLDERNAIPMTNVQASNFRPLSSRSSAIMEAPAIPAPDRSNKPKKQQEQSYYDAIVTNPSPAVPSTHSGYDSVVVNNRASNSSRIPAIYTIEGITYASPTFTNPPQPFRKTTPLKINYIYASTIIMKSTIYPPALNKNDLIFIKEIGSGEFASVYSGKMPEHWANSSSSSNSSDTPPARPPKPGTIDRRLPPKPATNLVSCAIKQLKGEPDKKTETDFIEEGKLMLELSHPNIVKVHAIFMDVQPFLTVLEMLEYGDLLNLLHICQSSNIFLYPHEFLHIISQISSAMKYLSEKPIIHRDLAARNVLVGSNLLVKISDFGLSRQTFEEKNYYKMNSEGKLPTRWMAPESLNLRKFSTASDVWSYGVTCWEIYSYGAFPYSTIPNMDIPAYLESNERLPCPPDCPLPLYELLLQCWNWDEYYRPTFAEIFDYLETQRSTSNAPVRDIGLLARSPSSNA